MRAPHYRQLAGDLQERVTTLLVRQLDPEDYSNHCTARVLLTCLVLAAIRRISLSAVAAVGLRCPSRETLRKAFRDTLPDYDTIRKRLPAWLQASLPRRLTKHPQRRRYPMAADLHRVAFYKRKTTPPTHTRKGQRLAGTRYAHEYATLCLLCKGQYYVVAATAFDPDETLDQLLRRLVQMAAKQGFSPRYVLLDRGFWSADVFRYLKRARYPFLTPVLARGRHACDGRGASGTRVFVEDCPTGRYRYQIANRNKQTATLTIVVMRRRHADRKGRHSWAYATWGMKLSNIRWVQQSYRRRFRIESSYRLLETARGRTSSRDEGLRLWYVVLGVLLVNLWLTLRREASGRWEAQDRAWYVEMLVCLESLILNQPLIPTLNKTQPTTDTFDPALRL